MRSEARSWRAACSACLSMLRFPMTSLAILLVGGLVASAGCAAPAERDDASSATAAQTSSAAAAVAAAAIDALIAGYPGLNVAVALYDVQAGAMIFERRADEWFWSMSSIKPYVAGAVLDARARGALVLPEGWSAATVDRRLYQMLHASANWHGELAKVAGGPTAVGDYFRGVLGMSGQSCVVGDQGSAFCSEQVEKTLTARDAVVGFAALARTLSPADWAFVTEALDAPVYNWSEATLRAGFGTERFFFAPKVGYYPSGGVAAAHETAYLRFDDRRGREFFLSVMTEPKSGGSADPGIAVVRAIMPSLFEIAREAAGDTSSGGQTPQPPAAGECFSNSRGRMVDAWWCVEVSGVDYQCDPSNPTYWPAQASTGRPCEGKL